MSPGELAELLTTNKYSDLKLLCRGKEFKVHKAIVCTQSSVLAAACDGMFQEAVTNTIHVNEFDPEVVKCMVEFLYTKGYETEGLANTACSNDGETEIPDEETISAPNNGLQSPPTPVSMTEILLRHIRVNAIADYYNIAALQRLANLKIQDVFENAWSADSFSDVAKTAMSSTSDKELHALIASTAAAHIEEIVELDDFTAPDLLSDFALDIIRKNIATSKLRENAAAEKLRAEQLQIRVLERRLQTANQEHQDEKTLRERETKRCNNIVESIDDCLDTLSEYKTCRNGRCEAQFACYIERGGQSHQPRYTLRCARCRCKH